MIHFAGLARFLGQPRRLQSSLLQQLPDLLLDLLRSKLRYRGGKVLHGVVVPSPLHQADTDAVHARIENVGAMRRRVHPLLIQRLGAGRQSYILSNRAKMGTCRASTRVQVGLAGILMGKRGLLRHELCVLGCGLGQRGVPLQRR